MYLESIVDPDNNGNGNDVVNRGYDFRLKLNPGKWKEGKNGTIRITFRNVMHTVADAHFPFYSTIDLQMVSEKKSYTAAGDPLFYLYPIRHDNRLLVTGDQYEGRKASVADAQTICENIGDGWRLPTASELLLSLPIWMLWVVMQQEAMLGISRIYRDGIETGVATTGPRPIIRKEILVHILNWALR